jgi:iron(III) transport system ATP-binding protein
MALNMREGEGLTYAGDSSAARVPSPCVPERTADAEARKGLRMSGIRHAFGPCKVVRGVDLAVAPGEIVCLLGPSGCGKTTLLRLAAGLERLQNGRIEIGGRVVADAALALDVPPEARRVGLMFQDFALFPHLTVGENIRFGIGKGTRHEGWIDDALNRAGLRAWADAYPHTLSGGQQQRCALLRALAPRPDVLLLDEPFSGLDAGLRVQVRAETATFLREMGTPALIVTHDPEEAMELADRLLVMCDGQIVQDGTPEQIYLKPVDPFVAELFGPLNRWEGNVKAGAVPTPLGAIPCPHIADGCRVVVLIRPEGLCLHPTGADAVVVESRMIGCLSAITVETGGSPWRLRALVPCLSLPERGTPVGVSLDPQRTFVFRCDR